MKKAQLDILNNIEKVEQNSNLLNQIPKTPQQHFMLTYASIHFINKGALLPILDKLLQHKKGSFSQLLLRYKFMKQCMEAKVNADNQQFHVLYTLVLWIDELQKISKNSTIKLTNAILMPKGEALKFQYYEQFIVYLSYLAVDIQNLFKSNFYHWSPDDLIQLLQLAMPKIFYNIVMAGELLGQHKQEKSKAKDELFCNISLEYFIRARPHYRGLCKLLLNYVINIELKANQMRLLIDLVCRYYLLFWSDPKQNAAELFITAFSKITEAVRFSLTDQLLLFFKICQKIGADNIEKDIRQKWQWIDSVLIKFGKNVVGHAKDEVNPFNSLNIKQNFTVGAGKSVERVIEIYHQHPLFYFNVEIEGHDINIKLFYLGDFESKIQVKKILHNDQKKSGQAKYAFMAAKRGIYMIEFDNSYSWINSKTISLEYAVLTPFRGKQNPNWFNNLFEINTVNFMTEGMKAKQNEQIPIVEKEIIQTHNLQEIYSSQQYQLSQLREEEQIEISNNMQTHDMKLKGPNQTNATPYQEVVSIKNAQIKELQKEIVQKQPENSKQIPTTNPLNGPLKTNKIDLQSNGEKGRQNQKKTIRIQRPTFISEIQSAQQPMAQANLSLIDNIFSLLVNTEDHTYEFETNLQDRIVKKLKSYCDSLQQYQWIVNGEARDWLKRHGFNIISKGAITLLTHLQSPTLPKKEQRKISIRQSRE